jgi:hypothetical protein
MQVSLLRLPSALLRLLRRLGGTGCRSAKAGARPVQGHRHERGEWLPERRSNARHPGDGCVGDSMESVPMTQVEVKFYPDMSDEVESCLLCPRCQQDFYLHIADNPTPSESAQGYEEISTAFWCESCPEDSRPMFLVLNHRKGNTYIFWRFDE